MTQGCTPTPPNPDRGLDFAELVESTRRRLRDIIESHGARACVYSHTQPALVREYAPWLHDVPATHYWSVVAEFLMNGNPCTAIVTMKGRFDAGRVWLWHTECRCYKPSELRPARAWRRFKSMQGATWQEFDRREPYFSACDIGMYHWQLTQQQWRAIVKAGRAGALGTQREYDSGLRDKCTAVNLAPFPSPQPKEIKNAE